ncbi:hypothetical protein GSU68_11155 [Rathayibacter sp. VKM Ac-2759]|uniref:FtsK/SpoIIIE domain-containing protein n=1 Tax=Rathayibacter sp. VKM Ac-2759 TaxID=2609252 RepID=UPI00131696F1|nr:FtsK/SpoIIIE domain-containing protein [Rathayibacter sp. VKM Ac-2759]QHC67063.1 hypothetical protein GSU68_11155 [Rathayibacter sp. VKM Ac-2759]
MTFRPAAPPTPPPAPPRASFPWIAALAPVLSSLVLYALTSSPYTLALAALGPVIALASFLDGVRGRKRSARVDEARYERLLAEYDLALADSRARELTALRIAAPGPLAVLERSLPVDARWRRRAASLEIVLGTGELRSGLPERRSETTLPGAPLTAPLAAGIGVVGPPVLARAFVRGLLLQCAELASPGALSIGLPPHRAWDGLRALPHNRAFTAPVGVSVLEQGAEAVPEPSDDARVIVLTDDPSRLPTACRVVVLLGDDAGDRVVGRVLPGATEDLSVDYVSSEQARAYALALGESVGGVAVGELPSRVLLAQLGALERRHGEQGLRAVIGVAEDGPLEIDLVGDGPHAIIGGTTGSGKTELLVAWIVALAARHDPAAVTFLLADFKGGAGFAALAALPHVTGVITDLDPGGAARAFASVAAELRRREIVLAQHGVADVARLAAGVLARLVIVVDECAVVLERAPELHRAFADITARGRSLGVHLVLCTQRPVGVVRDAVAANCGLRIALRVQDAADSRALIGSDAAARLPHGAPGRCIVSLGGQERLVQAAVAPPEELAAAVRPGDAAFVVHRPWRDPLPSVIPLPADPGDRLLLGLVDRPEEQSQDVVSLERRSVLVLGASGSGRTGVLRTIAGQLEGARLVGAHDPERAWDAVMDDGAAAGPLLLDDLDLLLRRCADDERRRLLDALQTAVRAGERRVVVAARRLTDGLAAVRDAFDDVLLLRASNRQEHQLLALSGERFDPDLPPGGGWWHGERIQVFAPGARALVDVSPPPPDVPIGSVPVAVLTNRARAVRSRLEALGVAVSSVQEAVAGGPTDAVVGTVLEWSSSRGLLATMRGDGAVVLDVPPSEARLVLGALGPAPLCAGDRVLIESEGVLHRARWPAAIGAGHRESAV